MNTIADRRDPRAVFARTYQDLVDRWPVPVTALDLPTGYGMTHVLVCGEHGAPAVFLLPGGGATATAWRDVAAGLSGSHRVIAADPIGQPGLSTPGGQPIKTALDLVSWTPSSASAYSVRGIKSPSPPTRTAAYLGTLR